MSDSPLVSIICVSMNHAAYVQNGLQSFIKQTYPNIEILYLDNASGDNTFEIAEAVLLTGNRPYQSCKREQSYNLPENFNYLIKKAGGKYLCFISCDDWMLPEFIQTMVKQYEQQQHIGLLYSNGWYYYENTDKYELAANKKFISGKIFDHIFLNGVLFPIGIMIRKEAFDRVGPFDESLPIEDYDMWLRIADKYEIGYSQVPAIYYRKHSKSMTGLYGYKNIKYYLQIVEKYKSNKLYNKVTRNFRKFLIYEHLSKGEKTAAFNKCIKDFRIDKFYASILFKLLTGKTK